MFWSGDTGTLLPASSRRFRLLFDMSMAGSTERGRPPLARRGCVETGRPQMALALLNISATRSPSRRCTEKTSVMLFQDDGGWGTRPDGLPAGPMTGAGVMRASMVDKCRSMAGCIMQAQESRPARARSPRAMGARKTRLLFEMAKDLSLRDQIGGAGTPDNR